MSRSYKQPIIKDKGLKDLYWKQTRSNINQTVRMLKYDTELEIPNEKVLMNDYDYSDYTWDMRGIKDVAYMKKLSRK